MAEQNNKSAEQLLSDLHQKRLEQALNEFNADKTRMAVGRLLEEYVDDGGQSYFDGAQKDATLYFVDDDYMDKVSDVEPKDENKPKKEKKGGFFAGALSKLAEKMKTEEPEDYEDEFPEEIEEYKDDKDDDVNLIDGTNKGFDMPAPEELEPVAPIEEEEAVPPVKPSIFDTAKLSSMDLNDIEERLEKVHLKPATMEFADPDDVLKEILGETEAEEKTEEPKEDIKKPKKENRKVHKKKESLDDISVDDMGLGNIVNKIAEEEELKHKEETEEAPKTEEVETNDDLEVSAGANTEAVQEIEETESKTVEEEPVQEMASDEVEETPEVEDVTSENTESIGESTITVTSVPEEIINNVNDEIEEQENHSQEDYPTKFKEKNDNKNTYVAEKTVILDKPLIDANEVISDDDLTATEDNEAEETQPVSQEDNDMTKEEEVLNAITNETEAEVEEDVIPSRRRRFIEEKKKGKKKQEEPVEEEIEDDNLEEDEYEDDFDDTEDKPKKGLFGLFKKKKKKDEDDEDDFEDDEEEIEDEDNEVEDQSEHNDEDENYDEDEDLDEEDDDEEDYDDFDDEYRKGSGLKKFFIGALFVILVVAVTALAAMCYSYKLQLDSTREQLNKIAGNNTEETTAIVEDITSEITTQATTVATTEAVTESATTAVVSSGNNNTQAVQIVNSDGTSSNLTGATASGTTYTVKSGDTGEKICKSVYGEYTKENWSKILKANNMNESSTYHPGQELIIP